MFQKIREITVEKRSVKKFPCPDGYMSKYQSSPTVLNFRVCTEHKKCTSNHNIIQNGISDISNCFNFLQSKGKFPASFLFTEVLSSHGSRFSLTRQARVIILTISNSIILPNHWVFQYSPDSLSHIKLVWPIMV